jgi:hypothetical protein
MTEKQALYQNEANLDAAYQRLLAHPEALSLERERFEEELLNDSDEFSKWAFRFVKQNDDMLQSFFEWCWGEHEKELTPAHERAWEDELPSNAEYWNWNDDRV